MRLLRYTAFSVDLHEDTGDQR